MLFTEIIRAKREGEELTPVALQHFVDGLADGSLPPEQVAALTMAIYLNSMSGAETATLTSAMANSGTTLRWQAAELGGPVVDKHSTGGIGDKVSLLLAPIAAACGCFVPMISGRGLGHTGGTLDKMASIPGYCVTPDLHRLRQVVAGTGCAIVGASADIAPADRRLYAVRDVTATVESVPLITASILSKKLAAGIHGLVLDVKVGTGAFLTTMTRARELVRSILTTALHTGLRTRALITDMNEALGTTAGNAVEVGEAIAYLTGGPREPRLDEVVLTLSAELLVLAGLETAQASARRRADAAVTSGRAAEVFTRMVAALGGPADLLERPAAHLPRAAVSMPVVPATGGYLNAVDARSVGNAIVELGGGRRRMGDDLDHAVGFTDLAPIGARCDATRPLAVVHAASRADAERAQAMLIAASTFAATPPAARPVVYQRFEEAPPKVPDGPCD